MREDFNACKSIWNLDWDDYLPRKLTDTITMHRVDYNEGFVYTEKHFPEIFNLDGSDRTFFENPFPDLPNFRANFYRHLGDFFVMKEGNSFAGMAICHVGDWSSYYIRNVAILPKYQELGIYRKFWELLLEVLGKHNVARVEGDVSPSNHHHLHVLNQFSIKVTSVVISERWGALLHLTKFIKTEDDERFGRLFSSTFSSDARQNGKHSKRS